VKISCRDIFIVSLQNFPSSLSLGKLKSISKIFFQSLKDKSIIRHGIFAFIDPPIFIKNLFFDTLIEVENSEYMI